MQYRVYIFRFLHTLTKLSSDEDFFNKLVSAKNADAVMDLFAGVYVKKDLTVSDIMSVDYECVQPESNLKELTDMYYKRKTSYLPVADENDNLIGEVRINDLLAVGIPDYAVSIGSLSFLSTFEPFDKLLREEENIHVREIMKKPAVTLSPEASVVEAALKMSKGNYRHLAVVDKGRLIGILNVMDILTKVLRS